MKQHEVIINIMEENGGYATLGFLNQNAFKNCKWKTKTPFASIRRIVQDKRFFFKIKPGLWALKTFKDKLPVEIFPNNRVPKFEENILNHTYYQGLLVEIGNFKNYQTFIPNQDKNKKFLNKKLGGIATIEKFYQFGYAHIINKAKTVDVTWFNDRKMPNDMFEVEHSTNIQNSLLKFVELQDFNTRFFIAADKARKKEFEAKLTQSAFFPIKKRVRFLDYGKLSELHATALQLCKIEQELSI